MVWRFSKTAASNASADSTINFAEGQAPSSLNDSNRAVMARVAQYRDDISGTLSTTGTSTAYAVSTNQVFDSFAHLDGNQITFTPHVNCSTPVTLNVDGLGAKALRSAPGIELQTGALRAGVPYTATYFNSNGELILRNFYGQNTVTGDPSVLDFMTAAQVTDVTGRTGAVDVSTPIQNAINSISGGRVRFPPGTYLAGGITLKPGIALVGAGVGATTIKCLSNSITVFGYNAASNQTYFVIKGMTLDINGKSNCVGINLVGASTSARIIEVRLEDLYISGFTTAISRTYTANSRLTNINIVSSDTGYYQNLCADNEYVNCAAQNGSGNGFDIRGNHTPYDEGTRMVNCSTNGQARGLYISGADWGKVSSCSFTTCSLGSANLSSTSNWDFSASEFAPGSATPGLQMDSGCTFVGITGSIFQLGSFGLALAGQGHTVVGNKFWAQSNVDINSDAANSVVNSNLCLSTGAAYSIVDQADASANVYVGNRTSRTILVSGASSYSANNLTL